MIGISMGLIETTIILSNPSNADLASMQVSALVDTWALHLCIPEHIALQLQLKELEKREVILADGKRQLCAYCGPVKVTFQNRSCFVGALVLGDSVLLGVIPMEDMDLVVEPATRKVTVNPLSPNIPFSTVK
jgi:clan AA aspartic protease